VVPLSGGKDSTYVLYYAVKILELKTIAVTYDSGFQSNLARENVKNACTALNVPLVVKKADYDNHVKMLREALRIAEIVGTFFGICGNCETLIRTVAINTAKVNSIPFVLYGSSRSEDYGIQPFLGLKGFVSRIALRNLPRLLFHMTRYWFYSVRQRVQMKVPIRYRFLARGIVPFPGTGTTIIHMFDYIEWDSINRIDLLKEKLNWKSPSDQVHRFDCLLHCFADHKWLQECGVSVNGFNYSTMIREDRMRREEAILRERKARERVEKECLEIIEKVGLMEYRLPRI
jgi:hypothetical protein